MALLTVADFLGRFHPLLVHLPIGILLLACLFQWLLLRPKWVVIKPAIPVMLFWGMWAAIFSCITGYLLSLSGDYDPEITSRHQWMGIFTAIAAALLYLLHRLHLGEWITRIAGVLVIVLVSITGHLGGTLTHGEGYLVEGLNKGSADEPIWQPMANVQEAKVYEELVQPLLQARCYSCHGSSKQKGKLRLDEPQYITKGGEGGKVIETGQGDESELVERLLLPLNDDDHMPPKEKPQLTQSEIALLHWWIQSGADYSKKVSELEQDDKIKPVLMSIQTGVQSAPVMAEDELPAEPVKPADVGIIEKLKNAGVMIFPVAANSNYLQASFFTARRDPDSLLALLSGVKDQLVWLKLDGLAITDSALTNIAQLTKLRRLHLSNTPVSDAGIQKLNKLVELRSLNLFATSVTVEGLKSLQGLQKLRSLYLYQTQVTGTDFNRLKELLPNVRIDSGGYQVPTFEADTTVLKY